MAQHGFIAARLRMPRKVIAGYWQDGDVQKRIGDWMKAAVGVAVSKELKVMRFGDNMREVAVTEGDKVEVQAKLGPCSRSPWAAWFRFMKSMSISSLGISRLYWVAKWQ